MSNPIAIISWLVLGPIYNKAHQNVPHAKGDGHPLAGDIIKDIEKDSINPIEITRLIEQAPQEGDAADYGNGRFFSSQGYSWLALKFKPINWDTPNDVQDDIHQHLGTDTNPQEHLKFVDKHHALAFFLVYIHSPNTRLIKLRVRSDDALRVWLNGNEIKELSYEGDRDINAQIQETCCDIDLPQGISVLLAAVAETHFEWGFSTRVENAGGLLISAHRIKLAQGHVRLANGDACADTLIRVEDKDLRTEELLGETTTDDNGYYQVPYIAEQFARAEKRSADLIVTAKKPDSQVVKSPILFNAGPVEVVNLYVGGENHWPASEFENLVNELTPLLQQVPQNELTADDVVFLAGETGLDARYINWLAESARRHIEVVSIAQSTFYGLFRQNLPTALDDLLAQELPILRTYSDPFN